MPYHIEPRGNRVCVVKTGTGRTLKCYPKSQRSTAEAYLRALYANEPHTMNELAPRDPTADPTP